jgi:hypothetical protein
MALISSVPKLVFTDSGVEIPTDAQLIDGVFTFIDAAFGGGLNPENLETPQGQLTSSFSALMSDKNSEVAYIVNQVDPRFSDGRFQDAIARIYFLERKPATPTVVEVILGGLDGTVIPSGTLARDTSGNTYTCVSTTTIGVTGSAISTFQNIVTGPIGCPAGTLNRVSQGISGWDTITNPSPGVLGSNVESREAFEYRRANSVQFNANGTPGAIYAALFNLPDVSDVFVYDNFTNNVVLYGSTNYPLAPHSVFAAVVGGDDEEIAKTLVSKKDVGCDYNGNTTVVVFDTSGYNFPYPSYNVKFERPAPLPVLFDVSIVNDPSLPADIVDQIKQTIINRFTGSSGGVRERIGSSIFASNYFCGIAALNPAISILSILIGTVSPTLTRVDVGIDQAPTISESDITVNLM